MGPLTGLRIYGLIGAAAVAALLLAWALRLDHLRAEWKDRFDVLSHQAGQVLAETRIAADNPDLTWKATAPQIAALGRSNQRLKAAIGEQNKAIDDMAREAVRLRARAEELQVIADKARAQRKAALTRLADMSITPGTRADCETLLREAEDALDLVYQSGL